VFQAAGQSLHRFQRFIDMGDFGLQLEGFPGGLQASTHTGEQHETKLLLGVLERRVYIAHGKLQPLGGRAEVSGQQCAGASWPESLRYDVNASPESMCSGLRIQ
jgi:hypothetical protein